MQQRLFLGFLAAAVLAFNGLAGADRSDHNSHVQGHFEKCAKVCALCSLECDSCFKHCANMVGDGMKEHIPTMNLCLDCGEFCTTGARLSARHSTLTVAACEACAKACEACAAACEKVRADEHMKVCGKTCRSCAAVCREMIKHSQQQN